MSGLSWNHPLLSARHPLPVDALTLNEAAERICALAAAAQGGQVVTLNPEIVMRARRDAGLAQVIHAARLVTADGMGVVWALRLVGQPIPARVSGVDLAQALASVAAARGLSLYLLGGERGVAQAAAAALSQQAPGLRVAGWWDGSPQPHADADAITRIRLSGAQIALVAYGAPAQEFWIARNMPALPGVVAIGVGGAFDMLAGRVPRAPRWAQSTGLEWLYRLRRQPSRWWRMRALPQFALLAGVAALRRWLTRAEDTGMLTMRGPAHITGAAHARAEPRD